METDKNPDSYTVHNAFEGIFAMRDLEREIAYKSIVNDFEGLSVFLIISWFVVGFIGFVIIAAEKLRGEPVELDFFDDPGNVVGLVILMVMGLIGFAFAICYRLGDKGLLARFIHKLANIGVKK